MVATSLKLENDTPVENMLHYISEESYKISTTLLVLSYTAVHSFPALKIVTEPNEWSFVFRGNKNSTLMLPMVRSRS
jgi:hypothetical protein